LVRKAASALATHVPAQLEHVSYFLSLEQNLSAKARRDLCYQLLSAHVFYDETFVSGNVNSRRYQWVFEKSEVCSKVKQAPYNSHRVHCGAWITVGGRSPLFELVGTIDTDQYIKQVLERHVLPAMRAGGPLAGRIFQQDGAGAHRGAVNRGWFDNNGIEIYWPWPANSPMFNPIERVWALLNQRLDALDFDPHKMVATRPAFLACVQQAWASITQQEIDKIIFSSEKAMWEWHKNYEATKQ
jgi:hypothetical protein